MPKHSWNLYIVYALYTIFISICHILFNHCEIGKTKQNVRVSVSTEVLMADLENWYLKKLGYW